MSASTGQTTQNKPAQAQRARSVEPAPSAQAGGYGEYVDPGLAIMLAGSAEQQAKLLANPGLQNAQRQTVARKAAARHGNQQFQRLLAGGERSLIPDRATLSTNPNTHRVAREDEAPEKKKIDSLDPGQFTVNVKKAPTPDGNYTTVRKGKGDQAILKITAPQITMEASVVLNGADYEFNEGDSARVGPVQVLTSSVRTGVYVKDGQEVARYSETLNNVRDARPLGYAGDNGPTFKAEKPFYDRTNSITNDLWEGNVNFIDRPSVGFPIHFGGGTLTRVEGSDDFVTSIGVKSSKSGQILLLNPFGWRANWSMTLDASLGVAVDEQGRSTAKGLETWKETVGQVVDSDSNAAEIAANKQPILTFLTLDAAMTEPAASLWLALVAARQSDPASVVNIEQALRAKDPTFRLKVQVIQAATGRHWSLSKSDAVSTWANGTKQSANKGPVSIEEGKAGSFDFKLTEIIDPSAITGQSTLTVWAGGMDSSNPVLGDSLDLTYPFLSGGEIGVSSADQTPGRYALSVSMS